MKFKKKSKVTVTISMTLAMLLFCSAAFTGAYANTIVTSNTTVSSNKSTIQTKAPKKQCAAADNLADTTKSHVISNINLTAEDSNIVIKKSSDENFRMDYDKTIYNVKNQKSETSVVISINSKLDNMSSIFDKVIIYVPECSLNSITVKNNNSGLDIQEINANFNLDCESGALSVSLPRDFSKSIDLHCVDSSGNLEFYEDSKNYTLNIASKDSSITVPSNFPIFNNGTKYRYTNGNGNAKISVDSKDSAFSIKIADHSSVYSPYFEYGLTVKHENGKDILFYNGMRVRVFIDKRKDNSLQLCYTDDKGIIDISATKDSQGKITGIDFIPKDEAMKLLIDFGMGKTTSGYYNPTPTVNNDGNMVKYKD